MNEAAQRPLKTDVQSNYDEDKDNTVKDINTSIVLDENINTANDVINSAVHDEIIHADNDIINPTIEEIIDNIEMTHAVDDNDESKLAELKEDGNIPLNGSYEIGDCIITKETISRLQQNKRSDTMKSLQRDNFGKDSHNNEIKQNAFYTNNPLVWFDAIKNYLILNRITNRCDLKKNKDDIITICKINLCFRESKQIDLALNFVTGVFKVKGASYLEWINSDFKKVKNVVNFSNIFDDTDINDSMDTDINPTYENIHDAEVVQNEHVVMKDVSKGTENDDDDIKELWSCYEDMKTSINNLEDSVNEVNDRLSNNRERFEDNCVQIKRLISDLDKKMDTKVSIYQEELEKFVKSKIESTSKSLEHKIASTREFISKFTPGNDQQENEVDTKEEEINNLKENVVQIERSIEKIDFSGISESLTKLEDSQKEDIQNINNSIKDIYILLSSHKATCSDISAKVESIRQLESIANRTLPSMQTYRIPTPIDNNFTNSLELPRQQQQVKGTMYQQQDSNLRNVENHFVGNGKTVRDTDTTTELVMLMDSNMKFLNLRKLWTMNGTDVKRCGNLREVNTFIQSMKPHSKLKYFFISVGCNDIDTAPADVVLEKITNIVKSLREKYPGIKIILSEITPRMDDLDFQVQEVNTLLNQYIMRSNDIFIVRNGNMRDPDFFIPNDNKHFKQSCIARFAANIKRALNKAYGRERYHTDRKIISPNTTNNYGNTLSYSDERFQQGNMSLDASGIINNFKASLLRTITAAFERADF